MKSLILLAVLMAFSGVALADSGVSAVFVRNNEIMISTEAGGQLTLTKDRIPKHLPLWSIDGSKIAFIERTGKNTALARLRVIDRAGNGLSDFLIHPTPANPREVVTGMRFVERMEWVTDSKIAVSGSINPSTCENIIFDLTAGGIADEFYDDGCNAAYSPDGLHVAYITGAPHFTPESKRERELMVDGRRVFPPRGVQVKFAVGPKWNADSRRLAVVATNDKTRASKVVVWQAAGRLSTVSLPMRKETIGEDETGLFWNGENLILTSHQQAWSVLQNRLKEVNPSLAANKQEEAATLRKELAASLPEGAGTPDFWCRSCPLSLSPRVTRPNDE